MLTKELTEKYLNFFKEKGHAIIASASLIPENDPTVLFTTAGMHPLVPYLLGEKHPAGNKLVSVQKCIRTSDIDEVGDNFHLTFFEMLGNWSLGDYFKEESIKWSYEFLTKALKLDKDKLAISCFSGDNDAPRDEESADIWHSLGIPLDKIYFLSKENNWWGPAGQIGPCGPDTEIFYWTGSDKPVDMINGSGKEYWVEIWNNVFMQYNKNIEGQYELLKQKNVDTGMGVERTIAAINGYQDVYQIDNLSSIISKISELTDKKYEGENIKYYRIIADHLRAATFIMGDEKGIGPSNIDQGYVVRKLIRRAIRYGEKLNIKSPFTYKIAQLVIDLYKDRYQELEHNSQFIIEQLKAEEEKFAKTLDKGKKIIESVVNSSKPPMITGKRLFDVYQTHSIDPESVFDELDRNNVIYDKNNLLAEFDRELLQHQELSRSGSEHKFQGGLADNSKTVAQLHTATHLLLAALRQVLGDHVFQKGSNITSERLRFDFSHSEKMTLDQIKQVEDLVNEQIKKGLEVKCVEMSLDEAKSSGAMGVFENKYGEKVKVYSVDQFSREICGGPHASNTKELGSFKIIKEEAVANGIRRIKAVISSTG